MMQGRNTTTWAQATGRAGIAATAPHAPGHDEPTAACKYVATWEDDWGDGNGGERGALGYFERRADAMACAVLGFAANARDYAGDADAWYRVDVYRLAGWDDEAGADGDVLHLDTSDFYVW